MAIDDLHFTWDDGAAAHDFRKTGETGRFDEYIDFLEQFDWRGTADTVDRHIDQQFVLPAEQGDGD